MAKKKKGLSGDGPGGRVPGTSNTPAAAGEPDAAADLARDLSKDRIKRRLTWPEYAVFLAQFGVGTPINMSTIYKIVRGVTKRPHDLTIVDLRERLTAAQQADSERGAARAMVPGR